MQFHMLVCHCLPNPNSGIKGKIFQFKKLLFRRLASTLYLQIKQEVFFRNKPLFKNILTVETEKTENYLHVSQRQPDPY